MLSNDIDFNAGNVARFLHLKSYFYQAESKMKQLLIAMEASFLIRLLKSQAVGNLLANLQATVKSNFGGSGAFLTIAVLKNFKQEISPLVKYFMFSIDFVKIPRQSPSMIIS